MKKGTFSLIGLLLLVSLLAACGSSTPSTGNQQPASSTPKTPSVTSKAPLDDTYITSIAQAAQADNTTFHAPLDATPDGNGTAVYFTATGLHGQGVFRIATAGGAVTQVHAGSPFVTPRAIALSADGTLLTIADPTADKGGALFTIPVSGGTPTLVAGSQGTAPQNLNVYNENGQQVIYFTGKDPQSGEPAVLTLPLAGAQTPTIVAKGMPLVSPDGIVVDSSDNIYVSDRTAASAENGKIFKITNHSVTVLLNQVHTGNPAGIALSPDASVLLISAHQTTSTSDQVLLLDLSTLKTGSVTKVVGQNVSAAGLHASPIQKGIFAWADSSAGPAGGRVFVIR